MDKFTAELKILVGNPLIYVPGKILKSIFSQANKQKGPIPVKGKINEKHFRQTLLKYSGEWRLYINMKMLNNSPRRIGETIKVEIEFDPEDRTIEPHPKLLEALNRNRSAKDTFEKLSPSKQKEIVRYISNLKTKESIEKNVKRAINLLLGRERFVGQDKP